MNKSSIFRLKLFFSETLPQKNWHFHLKFTPTISKSLIVDKFVDFIYKTETEKEIKICFGNANRVKAVMNDFHLSVSNQMFN